MKAKNNCGETTKVKYIQIGEVGEPVEEEIDVDIDVFDDPCISPGT